MSEPLVAIVTGGNRGLGFETSRQLAKRGIKTILTSRDHSLGEAAVRSLKSEHLDLLYHPLDVSKAEDIQAIATFIKNELGRLDILVNNAGVFLDAMESENKDAASFFNSDAETLRKTLEINTIGPFQVAQALVPLMEGNGRVINLSSGMGQLTHMNGGCPAYRISKTAVNALTRLLADELRHTQVAVNSVCPGWVKTDMGGPHAERFTEEGVDTVVWLAMQADGGPTGGFFRDRQMIAW